MALEDAPTPFSSSAAAPDALGSAEIDAPSDERLREHLAECLGLSVAQLPSANRWVRSGNSIGAIALRLGLMSLDDVEQVIDLQAAAESRRFGELGCLLGMICHGDVRRLLDLQQAHRALDEMGATLLGGEVALPDVLRALADYFDECADEVDPTLDGVRLDCTEPR